MSVLSRRAGRHRRPSDRRDRPDRPDRPDRRDRRDRAILLGAVTILLGSASLLGKPTLAQAGPSQAGQEHTLAELLTLPVAPSVLQLRGPGVAVAGAGMVLRLRVLSATGAPVQGGLVGIYQRDGHRWQLVAHAVTDATGRAAVERPAPARSTEVAARFLGQGMDAPSLLVRRPVRVEPRTGRPATTQRSVPDNATETRATETRAALATAILDDPRVVEAGNDVTLDLTDTAAGRPGSSGAYVNPQVLRLILAVGTAHTVTVTAIESGGEGHCYQPDGVSLGEGGCPGDPHYLGDAVDFAAVDGVAITGRNAPALLIMAIAQQLGGGGGFGQSECGPAPALAPGWVAFPDACTHLHVQVDPSG
jgi:hypothetical protein